VLVEKLSLESVTVTVYNCQIYGNIRSLDWCCIPRMKGAVPVAVTVAEPVLFRTENISLGGYSAVIPAGSVIVIGPGTRIRLRL
jgi:hypothetical protein